MSILGSIAWRTTKASTPVLDQVLHRGTSPEFRFPVIPVHGEDPVSEIVASPDFHTANQFFSDTSPWKDGLVCAEGLALLYHVIRGLRPEHMVEIGTNKGWTAHVMARAAADNEHGIVETVGPYDSWRFLPLYEQWPQQVRCRTKFHPVNSAQFFQDAFDNGRKYDLFFVDGNHDYEYALFDIQCAARAITPRGYLFVDDADQADVSRAGADFLAKNPAWTNCCREDHTGILGGRDFLIYRAPGATSSAATDRSSG